MSKSQSSALSLKEYLKKYQTTDDKNTKKKNKKKKANKSTATDTKGVLLVDQDPIWAKPINVAAEDDDDEDSADDKPQINEDIEVKRMKRMEQIRLQRPYHAISEDGSGWVSVSDQAKTLIPQTEDFSPPRRRARFDTPSPEAENSKRSLGNDGDGDGDGDGGDISPPRQRRKRFDSPEPGDLDRSVGTNGDGSDMSPPRQRRKRFDSPEPDNLKRNFGNAGHDGDLSPPRQRRKRFDSPEPVRNQSTSIARDADLSPPRRSAADLAPPRKNVRAADLSPPRRNSRAADLSPPRRNSRPADLSPPRRNSLAADLSPPRRKAPVAEARAGLFTGAEIKKEIDQKRKEEYERYKELDPSVSGRGAEAIYRDKDGKRISKDDFLKLQKKEEKPKEKKIEWGKGLAQKREAEAKANELELEKDKPFARTRDDPELDKMFKERLRWGDPMAHLVKGKHSDLILEDLGDDAKMKESGFLIPQDIPDHSWIKRRIEAAPNRYGIKPGRHWDGVDRSTGYERELFKRTNEKQATEKEAYLWSVADM